MAHINPQQNQQLGLQHKPPVPCKGHEIRDRFSALRVLDAA